MVPGGRPPVRDAPAGADAEDRVPQRRRRADAAVLVRPDRAGPAGRPDGARRGARQLAARAGQAPRRDLRRGDRRPQHPDRHPAALRPGPQPATGHAGRRVPRPRGGPRGGSRGRQPGALSKEGPSRGDPPYTAASPVTRKTTWWPTLTAWSAYRS